MSYFPIPIPGFGGLNVADDPGDVGFGGAIDLLDVDFDDRGRVKQRNFFGSYIANTTLPGPFPIFWPGLNYFVAAGPASLRLYNDSNAVVATPAAPGQFINAQAIGTDSASYLYLTDYNATVRRLTTAGVLSAPAGMPISRYLARMPNENRMVAAQMAAVPTGSSATPNAALVHFSDAGAPETWGANNWVNLDPGDGDSISGAVEWGDLLFVFKQTKFFVFFGTSTDASGNPVFNYRSIRTGQGALSTGNNDLVAAGTDGVYFANNSGVYRTTGGPPVKVSGALDPLFRLSYPAQFSLGYISALYQMVWVHDRLYLSVDFTTSGAVTSHGILVYNPATDTWTIIGTATTLYIAPRAETQARAYLVMAGSTANAPIYRLHPSYSSDAYQTPSSRYQSGFENLAPPRRYIDRYGFGPSRKRIKAWRVKGSGTVTMAVAADFGSLVGSTALTLGTSPAVAEARYARAIRGAKISYRLSGTTAWTVDEMVAFLADTRGVAEDVSADA